MIILLEMAGAKQGGGELGISGGFVTIIMFHETRLKQNPGI